MASLDRMEVDDNSSDGESSDEENPAELKDKARLLAWARSGAPREPGRRGPVGSRRRLGPGLSRCVSFDF